MKTVQEQIKEQEKTNNTLQNVQIRFPKRTSRIAKITKDWFKDLTLNQTTLEENIYTNTSIISRWQNSILVSVNYCNSWSSSNNYSFLFSKEDFEKIENLNKYFKNLTK